MSRAGAPGRRSAAPPTRIFIIDDHAVMREGLAHLIGREPDLKVCGDAAGADEALRLIPAARPHVVVLDLSLSKSSGLTLIKDLRLRHPDVKVLVLSMHDESIYAERCLHAGALGYLMKDEAIDRVRAAIRGVREGRIQLSPAMADTLLRRYADRRTPAPGASLSGLSDRELEVFEMIGRGLGTSEIARRTHLSVKTIESHRGSIRRKLNLSNSAQLARRAAVAVETLRDDDAEAAPSR